MRLHWENYILISFHIEWDMIVVTVFLSILNQTEFHLVQNRKENCHHDHIPLNMKGNRNIVFSVQRGRVKVKKMYIYHLSIMYIMYLSILFVRIWVNIFLKLLWKIKYYPTKFWGSYIWHFFSFNVFGTRGEIYFWILLNWSNLDHKWQMEILKKKKRNSTPCLSQNSAMFWETSGWICIGMLNNLLCVYKYILYMYTYIIYVNIYNTCIHI